MVIRKVVLRASFRQIIWKIAVVTADEVELNGWVNCRTSECMSRVGNRRIKRWLQCWSCDGDKRNWNWKYLLSREVRIMHNSASCVFICLYVSKRNAQFAGARMDSAHSNKLTVVSQIVQGATSNSCSKILFAAHFSNHQKMNEKSDNDGGGITYVSKTSYLSWNILLLHLIIVDYVTLWSDNTSKGSGMSRIHIMKWSCESRQRKWHDIQIVYIVYYEMMYE